MMKNRPQFIYKLLWPSQWSRMQKDGGFDGAPIDLADGYIHLSGPDQVEETAAKHFSGDEDAVLLRFKTSALADHLKWEVSRGWQDFPHYYGALDMKHVEQVYDLERAGGSLIFPPSY